MNTINVQAINKVLWFTGMPGAGKSSIAEALAHCYLQKGLKPIVLDGDIFRKSTGNTLNFSLEDRKRNITMAAEQAKMLLKGNDIVIASFITPTEEIRRKAREVIGSSDYIEVYIQAPLNICEKRDPKGLYRKARKGEIDNFTGVSSPFETPKKPDIIVNTNNCSINSSLTSLLKQLDAIIN
jgi:adenylylsulfate kinase